MYKQRIVKLAAKFYDITRVLTDILDMLPIGLIVESAKKDKIEYFSKETLTLLNIDAPNPNNNILKIIRENKFEENNCISWRNKNYLINSKKSANGHNIISLTDVTIVKELNQVKADSAVKANLMQTLRHEIRTPLNGIIGVISSLKKTLKGALDSETKKLISVAIYSSGMISNLLNNYTVIILLGIFRN